jgi:hypothetical protein
MAASTPSRALAVTVRREACTEPGAPSGANARGAVRACVVDGGVPVAAVASARPLEGVARRCG